MANYRVISTTPLYAEQCLISVVLLDVVRGRVKVSPPFDPFDKRSTHNWYLFLCLCVNYALGISPQSRVGKRYVLSVIRLRVEEVGGTPLT